jgi:DNA-binding MarR family transcriptional regulator
MTPTEFLSMLRPALSFKMFTARQMAILALCAEAIEPISMIALSENLSVSKSCICRTADMLGEHNFIERLYGCEEEDDQRRVYLRLTDTGRAFLAQMGVS